MSNCAIFSAYQVPLNDHLESTFTVSNSIQLFRRLGASCDLPDYVNTEWAMAYITDTDEFDPETLRILGEALDKAWGQVVKSRKRQRLCRKNRACSAHFRLGQAGRAGPPNSRHRRADPNSRSNRFQSHLLALAISDAATDDRRTL